MWQTFGHTLLHLPTSCNVIISTGLPILNSMNSTMLKFFALRVFGWGLQVSVITNDVFLIYIFRRWIWRKGDSELLPFQCRCCGCCQVSQKVSLWQHVCLFFVSMFRSQKVQFVYLLHEVHWVYSCLLTGLVSLCGACLIEMRTWWARAQGTHSWPSTRYFIYESLVYLCAEFTLFPSGAVFGMSQTFFVCNCFGDT